jgi:hypothetical protein
MKLGGNDVVTTLKVALLENFPHDNLGLALA